LFVPSLLAGWTRFVKVQVTERGLGGYNSSYGRSADLEDDEVVGSYWGKNENSSSSSHHNSWSSNSYTSITKKESHDPLKFQVRRCEELSDELILYENRTRSHGSTRHALSLIAAIFVI